MGQFAFLMYTDNKIVVTRDILLQQVLGTLVAVIQTWTIKDSNTTFTSTIKTLYKALQQL